MRIALMSGAYKNAGDFLIEHRSIELLKKNIDNIQIDVYKRDICYDSEIEKLNDYDAIIFAGGPGFQKNLYPNKIPFVSDLDKLTVPYYIMGWGWKGHCANEKEIYSYSYTDSMLEFIKKASGTISCRDWYTIRNLAANGINNTFMTGCPAWYNLDYTEWLSWNPEKVERKVEKICISDPALSQNVCLLKQVFEVVQDKYSEAKIVFVAHRGITDYIRKFVDSDYFIKSNIEVIDISENPLSGFDIYNDCDIHVGFRVHAHIYNLSRGNVSVLLNEDARGNGVNDALGIKNIDVWNGRKLCMKNNMNIKSQLYDYLLFVEKSKGIQYANSNGAIRHYYSEMKRFIGMLG